LADETAEKGSPEYFGDTATQTASVLASIEKKLASIDLDMGDAVKMQTYLVAPKGSDGMDFQGFMEGYTQYSGTEDQPELPTRSVFAVAGLANPAWLVEVVAVRSVLNVEAVAQEGPPLFSFSLRYDTSRQRSTGRCPKRSASHHQACCPAPLPLRG